MNIQFNVVVVPFLSEEQHPKLFNWSTDRADYARAMVQELEDVGHEQAVTPMILSRLEGIMRRWMEPVFRLHGMSAIISIAFDRGRASLNVSMFPWELERFKQLEPILAQAMQTPAGMCACQATPGVRHDHG